MKVINVSLTIAQDWDIERADYKITEMAAWKVDCYGTDHATQIKCRILQGTATNVSVASFVAHLTERVNDDKIISLGISVTNA